jgi:hypothetical protein
MQLKRIVRFASVCVNTLSRVPRERDRSREQGGRVSEPVGRCGRSERERAEDRLRCRTQKNIQMKGCASVHNGANRSEK